MSLGKTAKPVILVPIPIQDEEKRRFTIGRNYVRSIIEAGGVPVLAPVTVDAESLRSLYDSADGVLLTGGADLDPSVFGEALHPLTKGVDPDREAAETLLARWAVADDRPMLCICRGVQQLNVVLGGSLIQDIPSQHKTDLEHSAGKLSPARDYVAHSICVEPRSQLGRALGLGEAGGEVGVNSFHHQALKRVADGLQVTSRAPDGIVESVEMPDRRFVVGVQWHPEEMSAGRADMLNLFVSFVTAAAAQGR
jgi:putative glutamine amidotransferase